jgi:SAM-dependent methyltransferase
LKIHPSFDYYCPICGSEKISHWGLARDIGQPEVRHNLSKCLTCTHLFINPLPSREFLNVAYKTCNPSVFTSNGFVEARSKGPLSVADEIVLSSVLKSNMQGAFLDVGSANLRLLEMIKHSGWRLTLIEPSQHAKQFEDILGCKVFNCSFEDCVFIDKFDIISVIDVLEHVYSPVDFLKRVKDILSDEGFALFRFPNSYSLRCRISRDKWDMIRPLGHLHFFSPNSFRAACAISGLRIEDLQSHDIYNYRLNGIIGKILNKLGVLRLFEKKFDSFLLGDQLFAKVIHG